MDDLSEAAKEKISKLLDQAVGVTNSELDKLRDALKSKLESKLSDEPEFKHHDAFMLMEYGCNKCAKVEKIWNGRNNVSPFGTSCSDKTCKGSMTHINWRHDVQLPLYQPPPGSRYFADFTRERAEEVAARMIKLYKGTEHELEVGTKEYNDLYWEHVHRLMNGDCSMDILTAEE